MAGLGFASVAFRVLPRFAHAACNGSRRRLVDSYRVDGRRSGIQHRIGGARRCPVFPVTLCGIEPSGDLGSRHARWVTYCGILAGLLCSATGWAAEPPAPPPPSQVRSVASTAETETVPSGSESRVAHDPPSEDATKEPTRGQRAVALGAAIFPGALVHGTGQYVLGRYETGTTILVGQGIGVGLVVLGTTVLVSTGAARAWSGTAAAAAIAGGGLLFVTWAADLYGVLAPKGGWGHAAPFAPAWEAEWGYRYVYDPQFDYRHFQVAGFDARLGRVRISPSHWASPDDGNTFLRAGFAYRPWGASPTDRAGDGSFVELEVAQSDHRYPRDRFALATSEWMLRGRLDLGRVAEHLEGSFFEGDLGTAYQVTRFDVAGADDTASTLLLQRMAFGIYVGDWEHSGGEWAVYYDHRHDGFAGGLLIPGGGGGMAGKMGLEGTHYFDRRWGMGVELQVGSAVVAGLSGRFRHWGGW